MKPTVLPIGVSLLMDICLIVIIICSILRIYFNTLPKKVRDHHVEAGKMLTLWINVSIGILISIMLYYAYVFAH
jgi:hypothetical protein